MQAIPSSYKDNSGFVFQENNIYFRAIHSCYFNDYHLLINSGLYNSLTKKKLFISHEEVVEKKSDTLKIIKPFQLPFISYAYEWSFEMLKDAALCTLQNANIALQHGMILKDANTHNIQFVNGKPMLIDSLSFEKYNEGESWVAYRQFCESFLAPLILMKYTHANSNKLLVAYPNGIPLEVCKTLLPIHAKLNMNVYLHIILPTKIKKSNSDNKKSKTFFSKQKLQTLIKGLYDFISNLDIPKSKTTWDDYYTHTILSKNYLQEKKNLVHTFLQEIEFNSLLDLGANDGEFSLHYANNNKKIIAIDEDSNCINRLYIYCKQNKIHNLYTIINDLAAPTPSLGWNHEERQNITERIQTDCTLALALIHHLAIANNIPLEKIIDYFYSLSPYLLIEFVAKEDEKVQQLLQHRKDIFDKYTLAHFTTLLEKKYTILNSKQVGNEQRWLFLAKRKV